MIRVFPPVDAGYTYLQTNRSDDLGSLWSTFNIDLQSNLGTMRVAPRMILNTGSSDDADLTLPVAFKEFDGEIWALTVPDSGSTGVIFETASARPSASFTQDNSVGAKTNYELDSDMEVFDGRLWASNTDGLYAKSSAGGAWTQITATPNAGLLQYFRKFDRLYIFQNNGTDVESISNADVYASSGDYTYSLPVGLNGVCMTETSDSIWIGTINSANLAGDGSIIRWDGVSPQATDRYYINANEICSMVTKNDVPFCMDSNGILSQFTGSSFEEVGRLPFGVTLPRGTSTSVGNPRYIYPHGMVATKNDTILVLVRNIYEDANDTIPENLPSGVWEWSKEYGFTHKYSITYTESTTITDYGQNRVWAVGAIANMNLGDDASSRDGTILVGANYATDSTQGVVTNFGIFYDNSINTIQKKGYFVTTWYNSDQIQDKWERAWTTYRRFLDSSDSVQLKYRLNEEDPTYFTLTWTSTTTFTTTTDITSYGPTATGFNGTVGGEVEILQGTGSGVCVHITNISENAGTYTVTLDEAVTGVTNGTARARCQKWIKLPPTVAQDQVLSYSQFAIGQPNIRIQIKVCMTFKGNDEFHKLALFSNEDIKINP